MLKPIRPSEAFAAFVCATLAFAMLGSPLAVHAQASPGPSPSASTPDSDVSPTPSARPEHRLKPIIFATKLPATPRPQATRKPVRHRATPRPFFVPTIRPHAPPPVPTSTPVPAPTTSETPLPSIPSPSRPSMPSPSPSPKPTPSPKSQPQAQRRAAPSASSPAIATAPPTDAGPTPIPTQPPTPRPLAPNQPTVPQSMDDPNVQGITARPIRELAQIGWMQGVWNVTGMTNRVDSGTQPIKPTTYVFSPIMKGRWMFGADGNAKDYIYLTFDPFARHWVVLRFGDNPTYGMWQSDRGWVGNRIDFVTNFSYVNGRQYRRRLTIIHKDARTFGIYELEQTPDGTFIPDDAYEFKKQ